MSFSLKCLGSLFGHNGWVTQIAIIPELPNIILSSSRDKTLIIWKLPNDEDNYDFNYEYGVPYKRLYGHSHFISDVAVSSDGNYAISGSWDNTLRLWNLPAGKTTRLFKGHSKDVLSVAFSVDNRVIVSGSRDKTINLWNTIAECKHTINDEGQNSIGHSDWVSCVRFSPNHLNYTFVSGGWDRAVKFWQMNMTNCSMCSHSINFGHYGYLNTVAVSPDGSICASGGKDKKVMLWDLYDGKHLHTFDHYGIIRALCFSPNGCWLSVASGPAFTIWDLESKKLVKEIIFECCIRINAYDEHRPWVLSMAWSADSQKLFVGYSDDIIRVFQVHQDHS